MRPAPVRAAALTTIVFLAACGGGEPANETTADSSAGEELLEKYTTVRLEADLSTLSDGQRQLVGLLIEAAHAMDEVFWEQAYGDGEALLASIEDPNLRRFARINYGPWDRLDDNAPFIGGVGAKPQGANFYPADMTREELEAAAATDGGGRLRSLYTMVRRGGDDLEAIPYHVYFADPHERAADLLDQAAGLAENEGFGEYLRLRAEALRTDEYQESDFAWMDLEDNDLDVVIGPIETYEDQLFGQKAAHETFVLLKDREWSGRLTRYADFLPALQEGLPVPDAYKAETPGTDADLGAYDVLFVSGDANAGSKTIAINLPNDEQVQLEKGTRRLQLKNAMRAKFDRILVPITNLLIAEGQRDEVTFEAFFENTMFHEVAHGLGIKNTLDGTATVRQALQDQASALEEGKADVLGLYMIHALAEMGELEGQVLEANHVTFVASIFRSIRFGAASAHGRANLARFNYFLEQGAFTRDESTGTYTIDHARIVEAMDALSERILTFQGDGDYDGVIAFMNEYAVLTPQLEADLERVNAAGIPVDIVYDQGPSVLGL